MTLSDPPTESGLDQSTSALTLQMAPALTILWHPDPNRVGNRFYFPKPGKGKVIGLSRLTPEFTCYCDKPAPLADTFLSHQPLLEISLRGQGFLLRPSPGSPLTLDGRPPGRAGQAIADPRCVCAHSYYRQTDRPLPPLCPAAQSSPARRSRPCRQQRFDGQRAPRHPGRRAALHSSPHQG